MTCRAPWPGTKHREACFYASAKIKALGKHMAGPRVLEKGRRARTYTPPPAGCLGPRAAGGGGSFTLKEKRPPSHMRSLDAWQAPDFYFP